MNELIQTEIIEITPAMAEAWLKKNPRNRKIKEDLVKSYAREMLAGRWLLTHQGIAFDPEGNLIDGQHRLLAIALSGKTVRMMITRGFVPPTMDAVDNGLNRPVADQLKIQYGMEHGHIITAICVQFANICRPDRIRRPSVRQIFETYQVFKTSMDFVIEKRSSQKGLKQIGILAGFAFAIPVWAEAAPLFASFNAGVKLVPESPLGRLRKFATSPEGELLFVSPRGITELALHALMLHTKHAKIPKLELSDAGVKYFSGLQKERVQQIHALYDLPQEIGGAIEAIRKGRTGKHKSFAELLADRRNPKPRIEKPVAGKPKPVPAPAALVDEYESLKSRLGLKPQTPEKN